MTLDKFIEENEHLADKWRPQYSKGVKRGEVDMVFDRCLKKYFIRKNLFRNVLGWLKGIGITKESMFMSRDAVVADAIQYTSWAKGIVGSSLVSEAVQLCAPVKFNNVPYTLLKNAGRTAL